jgi:hypothetical protein
MNAPHASDEVTDLIASIEMHRQEVERESGLEASRNYALPRLQELLRTEQEAAQQPEAGGPQAANLEAVNAAIRKLQSLGRGGGGQQQRNSQGKPQRPFRGNNPRREGQGEGQPGRPGQGQQRHRGRRAQARRGGGR